MITSPPCSSSHSSSIPVSSAFLLRIREEFLIHYHLSVLYFRTLISRIKFLVMDDDTSSTVPLVTKSGIAAQQKSVENIIEGCVGDFCGSQFLQVVLVSLAWMFDAQQTFISIFTDVQPTWHCVSSVNSSCNPNMCLLPKSSWSWDLPAYTSIVSEWSLECDGSIITGLPASSFYLGCLAGGFVLLTLADSSLGRKNTMLLSCIVMSMAGLFSAISTNIWMYSALRFISGFGRVTIGTCSLVLSSELVGRRWRGQVGTVGFFFFTLGFLSLPAIAYVNRGSSWRILYLWTCIPALLYCLIAYLFVHESPRWLFAQGRMEEFVKTLKDLAPKNKRSSLTLVSFVDMSIEQESKTVDIYSAIKIIFERKWALQRLIVVTVIGFGTGMVYYGMPLGVGNLSSDIYLSTTLNALSELPASTVTVFLIGRVNRRSAILGFTMLSCICNVICSMANSSRWKEVQIGMELVAFFSMCTAVDVLLIYALELFPTCIRNSAVAFVRQIAVFGGATSPLLIAAGKGNSILSYGVFGLTLGICGLFVGCLPETRGGTLCDTMEEEEQKVSNTEARALNNQGHTV